MHCNTKQGSPPAAVCVCVPVRPSSGIRYKAHNRRRRDRVYVTYIRTTSAKLWEALISADFARRYWRGAWPEAEWKPGGSWKLTLPDGRICDVGEIVAFEPEKRLVIRWRNEFRPELTAEGWSLCTMELETMGEAVKLTVTHLMEREDSKFIAAVSEGWPQILSNLKSLLDGASFFREGQVSDFAHLWDWRGVKM